MASGSKKIRLLLLAFGIILIIPGCNFFESIDQGINDTDRDSLVTRGNIALDEGRYADALELFERAENSGASDDTRRGLASSLAGLIGFNMFKVMNALQNGLLPGDSPAVFFAAAAAINDSARLQEAIDALWQLNNPEPQDLQQRGLLVVLHVCLQIIEKYDTNFNNRLDANDQIDFDTRDDKTPGWQDMYASFSSMADADSLELAFSDLATALNGRGENWVMISPVAGSRSDGLYTLANRQTVLAVANLATELAKADAYFDNSKDLFKQTIIGLDGVNP